MRILHLSNKKFILHSLFWGLCLSIVLGMISGMINEESLRIDFLEKKGLLEIFLLTVIAGPLIETLIFQYVVIETGLKIIDKQKNFILILVSALVFGISHFYSFLYVSLAFILGIYFGCIYVLSKEKEGINAFILVTIVHANINFCAFIIEDVMKL